MGFKWRWAGHLSRYDDQEKRISKEIEKWETPGKRNKGRPRKRWKDDLVEIGSVLWRRKAKNRKIWKKNEMTFTQQWVV